MGMPHSTPVADGGQIQNCSHRALKNGITTKGIFKIINQYKIEEHPDMDNYVKKDDLAEACKNLDNDIRHLEEELKDKKPSSMLDKIFDETSNLRTNNSQGLYAGDSLFAKV